MKIALPLILILLLSTQCLHGQVSGPDSVCSGYLYTYQVNATGADSVSWTLPSGWVVLNSSGLQINILCNVTVGSVCATAFDSLGNNLGQQCKTVSWGGGGMNWHVNAQPNNFCQCPLWTVSVVPDGTGGCGNCTGTLSPNLHYAVYNHQWPTSNSSFEMYADGVSQMHMPFSSTTYYVYLIDVTFGIQNAIRIEGGLCSASANNTFSLGPCLYANLGIDQTPDPVCVGDTVTLSYNNNFGTAILNQLTWQVISGYATLIPPLNLDHVQCVIDSANPVEVNFISYMSPTCQYAGSRFLNTSTCLQMPTASFIPDETEFCEGNCTHFQNYSTNASSYEWSFPGAFPASSNNASPYVCYHTPGNYDVTLIATNGLGSDTVVQQNYITISPNPVLTLTSSGDTITATPGYLNYQWYYYSILLPTVTGNEFVTAQAGNYTVIVTNSFNCTAQETVSHVTTGISPLEEAQNEIHFEQDENNIIISGDDIFETSLLDVSGRVVIHSGNKIIFTGQLASGVYTLKILKGKTLLKRKIFIR